MVVRTLTKGIGHIPKNISPAIDVHKRILLDRLPSILRGYGKTPDIDAVVIICDVDNRNKDEFLAELNNILDSCDTKPNALFCLAVEEFEAWYLGDLQAIQKAYPSADMRILGSYINDSVCGTWELLANAIYKGGHKVLKNKGWQAVGLQKSIWAKEISPHMNVTNNSSPSFQEMREMLRESLNSFKESPHVEL